MQAEKNRAKHGTDVEGKHYMAYEGSVVCKVTPCKNRIFIFKSTFGNHMFKKHGLISAGTSAYLYAQNTDDEQKRNHYNARRRKQPGASICTSYYEARGSMRARWSQAKYRARYFVGFFL